MFVKVAKTEYWFVLQSKTLSCCDVNNHNVIHFTIQLKGLKFRLMKETDVPNSNKQNIVLFKPNGGYVHNGNVHNGPFIYKVLKLSSKKSGDIRSWRKSLSLVIVSFDVFVPNHSPRLVYNFIQIHIGIRRLESVGSAGKRRRRWV